MGSKFTPSRNYVNGTFTVDGDVVITGSLSASAIIGGGSTTPGLPATSVQYNDGGAFTGDADFTWNKTTNALTVTGDITASSNISGAFFHGDGSGLTGVSATASPAGANTQIQFNADGTTAADADFTWLTGSNTLSISGDISGSGNVSGSFFYGDGSNLTNTPAGSPAGSNTQVQFNADGAFGSDADLAWASGSNTLTVTGDISASVNVSGSDFYGGGANLTALDADNISAGTLNNARLPATISVTNVSASTLVSASSFYGDASNLTGLPVQNYNNATDNFIITAADSNTVQGEANLTFDGTTLTVTGVVSGSGNVSGSAFYGDGSNLTNLTIPSGTIGRIDSTGAETFYLTISGAVAASVAGDYVRVGPGTYVEDTPINIPAGISVIGNAGWQVTEVSSSTGLGDVFVLSADSLLKDFNIAIPSDTGSYGAKFAGATGTATINFLSFYGGTGLRGSGYGNTGAGKTIGLEIRYSTGDCDAILEVTDGILAVEGVHVPNSAGAVDAGMRANSPSATRVGNRGRLQGIDINMGAPSVEDAIVVGSTSTVVLQGVNFFNIQNTFHLTSNSASLLVTSGLSEPTVNDIKVDTGLTGDGSITRLSAFMSGKFSIPYTWIPSDHAWTFFTSETDTSEASQQLWGARKIIGHPELGSGLSAGEGANYSTNNAVFTTDGTTDAASGLGADGTGFVDVSVAAESVDGSSFSFQGTTAGHSIMWCTKRVDSSNTTLKHWGLEVDQIGAAATGSGNFIIEYQNASSSWTEIGSMAVSSEEQYRYANKLFLRANSEERIYAGISGSASWDPTEINGVTGRWMRARIESTITTAPVFERFRLIPSHTEINKRGQKFASGLAQWKKTVSLGGLKWSGAKLANASFTVGTGTTFTQDLDGSILDQNGDYANTQFLIPAGTCTAFPIQIKFFYAFNNATPVLTSVTISHYVAQVQGNLIADPGGATVPIIRTAANTETFITNAAVPSTQNTSVAELNKVFSLTKDTPADIAGSYSGDMIFVHFEVPTVTGDDIILLGMELEGIAFTEGDPHD
jgi:hypothetical protein